MLQEEDFIRIIEPRLGSSRSRTTNAQVPSQPFKVLRMIDRVIQLLFSLSAFKLDVNLWLQLDHQEADTLCNNLVIYMLTMK